METRFGWQVREILDLSEVLNFKNINKSCNSYLSKSSRKKMPNRSLHLRICTINFTAPFAMSIIGLFYPLFRWCIKINWMHPRQTLATPSLDLPPSPWKLWHGDWPNCAENYTVACLVILVWEIRLIESTIGPRSTKVYNLCPFTGNVLARELSLYIVILFC